VSVDAPPTSLTFAIDVLAANAAPDGELVIAVTDTPVGAEGVDAPARFQPIVSSTFVSPVLSELITPLLEKASNESLPIDEDQSPGSPPGTVLNCPWLVVPPSVEKYPDVLAGVSSTPADE
jgi:hypothetical protein